ncbi:Serine/threonine exchanger SteT [Alphaproteobacteria bacterium SO-S41]|nr:Serine/threonine exchanger SteT [Alphaproteobacteria bacterium SO-S41]
MSEPAGIASRDGQPARHVSVAYLVMVAVALVIGAGIFKSPADVAANTGSFFWLMAAWIGGGLISLIGALCYAELATAFPSAGGDYHFLKTAYGRGTAFLFAWTRFAVINTGALALLGFVLGVYANNVVNLGPSGPAIYAFGAVALMTLWNLKGMYAAEKVDYALTGLEVVGVAVIVAAGLLLVVTAAPPATIDPAIAAPPPDFFQAMVFVLVAFGGWSEIATMSAEVKDGRRGMLKALVAAILVITALYVGVNWALWRGLGIEGLAASGAPAAELMAHAFGPYASLILAIAVALATLTSINSTIVVGSRTTYAAAHDWPQLAAIARWDKARGIPLRALLAQSLVALSLIIWGSITRNGFEALVNFTAPVFWGFMFLSGFALIVLRIRLPDAPRPVRVPLYPVLPLLFCAASAAMVWSSIGFVAYLWSDPENRIGAYYNLAAVVAGCVGAAVLVFTSRRRPQ